MTDLGRLGGRVSEALAVSGKIAVGDSSVAGDAVLDAVAWSLGATPTTTTVTPSANPARVGTPVTYTASVSPSPTAGAICFTDNGTPIAGCQNLALSRGSATCTVTYASTGGHAIIATFTGGGGYAGSVSPTVTEVVTATPCPTLAGCNLSKIDLSGADLSGVDLSGSNLRGANLSYANLTGANLAGANLAGASLVAANLTGANLTRANLTRANLTGANLTRANLIRATLNGVIWSDTTCPDGSNSGDHGGTCVGYLQPR